MYDGGPAETCETLCRRCREALCELSRDSLLFAPSPRDEMTRVVRSLADFTEYHRTSGTAGELPDLTRVRCVFASGDSGLAERFDKARREILVDGAARGALINELREPAAGAVEPGLTSIDDMRGGLRDVERGARFLYMTHTADTSLVPAPGAASIFRTAGAHGLIPDGAAERLAQAAGIWRNLRGILQLVAQDGFAVEAASPEVRAVIAQAWGMDDFGGLTAAIRETASRADDDDDALTA